MSSNVQAYVIESDGTKTAVPVDFVDNGAGAPKAGEKASTFFNGYAAGPFRKKGASPTGGTYGYAPQNPFTTVDSQTAAPRRSLHLGRRLLGLGIAAIGVPLLVLPGPGLALIGLGLLMVVMP